MYTTLGCRYLAYAESVRCEVTGWMFEHLITFLLTKPLLLKLINAMMIIT